MAKNVFISFRFSDGKKYKEELAELFNNYHDTVDYSQDEDRSNMSDKTIKAYLYKKLKRSSVTIVLLTPSAVNHEKNINGEYDDWMYDEIRYSLEDRENNRTNGIIAVYTPEATDLLVEIKDDSTLVKSVDNLFRKNMMNVKPGYKKNPNKELYDGNYDSYCSLVKYSSFVTNPGFYIDLALEKRDKKDRYTLVKQL